MTEPRLELKTVAVLGDACYSVLLWDGRPFAVSAERKFIPAGEYVCKRDFYYKGDYPTFEIHVPGRTRILFHKGNRPEESEGCVLVAESFGVLGQAVAILDSRTGFGQFMEATKGLDEFIMKVTGR